MKKLSIILILVLLFSLCGCAKQEVEDLSHLKLEYSSDANYFDFGNDINALYEAADYVIVGSPTETFEEAEQIWSTSSGEITDDFDKAVHVYSYTVRKFKVNKVLKGDDLNLKEIKVGESAFSDGKTVKILGGEYIAQKGNEYLLFLLKGTGEDTTIYWPGYYYGKYELNSSNNENNKQINQDMYKQAKELFKEEFK